jgi:hypothetical protein
MSLRAALGATALAWVLMHAGAGGDWEPGDEFPSELMCMRVRAIAVADAVNGELGALASQPVDNPMRQQAFARAERRVGSRYRCAWQGS